MNYSQNLANKLSSYNTAKVNDNKQNSKIEEHTIQATATDFQKLAPRDKNCSCNCGCGYDCGCKHSCESDEILQELKTQNAELKKQSDILERIEKHSAKDIAIKEKRDAQRMNRGWS